MKWNKRIKKDKYREYKIIKIVRNEHFYWRAMFKDKDNLYNDWNCLAILAEGTDYLIPAEYKNKFGAIRRIVRDKQEISKHYEKYEIFEEEIIGRVKIN
jgi:hypothetical protein